MIYLTVKEPDLTVKEPDIGGKQKMEKDIV